MTEEEMVYVINAVKLIADYGYLFLKFYRLVVDSWLSRY